MSSMRRGTEVSFPAVVTDVRLHPSPHLADADAQRDGFDLLRALHAALDAHYPGLSRRRRGARRGVQARRPRPCGDDAGRDGSPSADTRTGPQHDPADLTAALVDAAVRLGPRGCSPTPWRRPCANAAPPRVLDGTPWWRAPSWDGDERVILAVLTVPLPTVEGARRGAVRAAS
ncbi:hypothetical protein QJS66_22135 [Kocuria rhizophila]|nr:hypothetical protein QJS66_22135 [Kocuria rhizophila]